MEVAKCNNKEKLWT